MAELCGAALRNTTTICVTETFFMLYCSLKGWNFLQIAPITVTDITI